MRTLRWTCLVRARALCLLHGVLLAIFGACGGGGSGPRTGASSGGAFSDGSVDGTDGMVEAGADSGSDSGVCAGGTAPSSQSVSVNATGVSFTLPSGVMRLQVCADDIIRVQYTSAPSLPAKTSLSVNKVWGTASFCVTESTPGMVSIITPRLKVKVDTSTGAITYTDVNDNTILSETGKSTAPATVEGVSTYRIETVFSSPETEGLFGLGQPQDGLLNRKGTQRHLRNENTEIVIPFLVSTRGYGILWDNYSTSDFYGNDASDTGYRYVSEAGEMVDYYFMYGPSVDHVVALYRTATGPAPMFPKWAYGLFQSKDHYLTQAELLAVRDGYRNNNIPVDVIVQDWDYWKPYAWGSHFMDAARFPDPASLITQMHASNVHTMISVWPLYEQVGAIQRAGEMDNYNALDAMGALYPSAGSHHFYDAFNASARTLVYQQIQDRLLGAYGWDGIWADNTEPQAYPDSFDMRSVNTALGKGAFYINAYPLQHNQGLYEGWRARGPQQKRVYILTRSAFAGMQRYGAGTWSGDIAADFSTYARQIPAGLSYAISGMPYWTTDIGGYFGAGVDWSSAAGNELFTRWFQFGAFCPTFRIHGQGARELYHAQWAPATRDNLLQIDNLRYRLMPYIYSLAGRVTSEGYTIMRPLVFDYPADPKVYDIRDQYLFGPALLVNPVVVAGATTRWVYLPEETWYDFWSGSAYSGGRTLRANAPLSQIPLFVKAGSIVPMGPVIQYATQSIDPLELRIYAGRDGAFTLYEDEGDTYHYETGQHSTIELSWHEATRTLTIGARSGSYPGMPASRTFHIVVVGAGHGGGVGITAVPDQVVAYDGSAQTIAVGGTTVGGMGGSACPPAGPGALSLCPDAPIPGANDVYSLAGARSDGTNVNANGVADADGCTNDAYTYVAPDRVSQGQTFTTGSSPMGYSVTAIWVKHVGYRSNSMLNTGCSNGTWSQMASGSRFTVRITNPASAGSAGFSLSTQTFTATGNEGWPTTATSDINGDGVWVRFELASPVTLSPSTRYGFDLTAHQSSFFEWLGSKDGTLAGGSAYQGGTAGQSGGPDNVMTVLSGDRVFLLQLTPR